MPNINVNAGCSVVPEPVASWPPRDPCAFANLGWPCLPTDAPDGGKNDGSYYHGTVKCPDGSPMRGCPSTCANTAFAALAFGVDPNTGYKPPAVSVPSGGQTGYLVDNQLWSYVPPPPPPSAPVNQTVNVPTPATSTIVTQPASVPVAGDGRRGPRVFPTGAPMAILPTPTAGSPANASTPGVQTVPVPAPNPEPESVNAVTAAQLTAWAGQPLLNADQWCWYLNQHFPSWNCPAPETFGGGLPTSRVVWDAGTFLAHLRGGTQPVGQPVVVGPDGANGSGAGSGGGTTVTGGSNGTGGPTSATDTAKGGLSFGIVIVIGLILLASRS